MQDSDCLDRRPVRGVGNPDSCLRIAGVDNLSAADIDCHVIDRFSISVEDQITRFCLRHLNCSAKLRLCHGRMGQAHTIFLKDAQHKAGTVRSLCQTGTAPYIGIAQKFFWDPASNSRISPSRISLVPSKESPPYIFNS